MDSTGQIGEAQVATRPAAPTHDLSHHPGIAFRRLALWWQEKFDAALAPLVIKTRHFAVLTKLTGDPAMSQHDLGLKLGIDRSTMVKIIDDLERLGYVERRPHPRDRRAHMPRVTETGRAAAARGEHLLTDVEAEMLAPLGPGERATLLALLARLLPPPDATEGG